MSPITEPPADADYSPRDYSGAYCIDQGDGAFFRGDGKLALRWYTRAIDKEPGLIEPWLAMLRVLILKGDVAEAATWIHRGLTIFPENPRLLALCNVQLARRDMTAKALNDSRDLLERNPKLPLAHLCRGEVLMVTGGRHFDRLFHETLDLVPGDDWKTPLTIGMILQDAGHLRLATGFFAEAVRRSEQNPAAWFQLAQCHAARGHRVQTQRAQNQVRAICTENDPLLAQADALRYGSILRWLAKIMN
ncbi:hypothetical protein LLG95_14470 [bacterium]|nr:hypothetical protein [bacterium]